MAFKKIIPLKFRIPRINAIHLVIKCYIINGKSIFCSTELIRNATRIIDILTRSYIGRCFKFVPVFICTIKGQGCTWSKTVYYRDIIVFHFYFFLCFRTFQYIFGTNLILVKGRVLGLAIHPSLPFVDVYRIYRA